MDRTQSSFGCDKTKPRGIGAKCFYRLQQSKKRMSDRSSCRRVMREREGEGGGGDASKNAFGEIGQKYFKSPEERSKKPLAASSSPDCTRF